MAVIRTFTLLALLLSITFAGPATAGLNQWTTNGPADIEVRALVIDPSTPSIFYAGTQGQGVFKSTDRGATWNPLDSTTLPNPFISDLAIDPTTPSTLYAAVNFGVYKSTDGGSSWQEMLNILSRGIRSVVVAPTTPPTVYAGYNRVGVMRSTDNGATWENTLSEFFGVYTLAIDPLAPTTVYASIQLGGVEGGGGIAKSTDGGTTWNALTDFPAFHLAIDPSNPRILYGINGHGLFKSTNGGTTWTDANHGLGEPPVSAPVIDPSNPSTLYVGTRDRGAWRSIDAGASWYPLPSSGSDVSFPVVTVDPQNPSTLHAATPDGVFHTDLATELTLHDGRFTATVSWREFEQRRGIGTVALAPQDPASRVALRSQDSAVLEFFGPDNWESLVKVLDGRPFNGHY